MYDRADKSYRSNSNRKRQITTKPSQTSTIGGTSTGTGTGKGIHVSRVSQTSIDSPLTLVTSPPFGHAHTHGGDGGEEDRKVDLRIEVRPPTGETEDRYGDRNRDRKVDIEAGDVVDLESVMYESGGEDVKRNKGEFLQ